MRLTVRLVLLVTACICLVLALHAVTEVRRDLEQFAADIEFDHHAVAQALRPLLADAHARGGDALVHAFVDETAEQHTRVGLEFHPSGAPAIREYHVRTDQKISTFTPLVDRGIPFGMLEVYEALDAERAYARESAVRIFWTTAVLVGLTGLSSALMGTWLVGRPVARLVAHAERLGRGDFAPTRISRREDELTQLQRAMNTLGVRLLETRDALERESDARGAQYLALQHADRLATLGRLAAEVAHELGTPLTIIANRAQFVQKDAASSEHAREQARHIAQQVEKITTIVRRTLKFARPSAPSIEEVELDVLCRQCAALLGPLARERGVVLVVQGQPLLARVDSIQIEQAITNLVINAIEALPREGRVTVETSERVETFEGASQRLACIEVSDDGPGVPQEFAGRLFAPFFTTKQSGSGLGLAIASQLVRDHGGQLTLEPSERGARFVLRLPDRTTPTKKEPS